MNYFDLTDESKNITHLIIKNKIHDNGYVYDCEILDKEDNLYKGFKIAESKKGNIFIVCDVSFQKSANDNKHHPRLTFRKTNADFKTQDIPSRSEVIIAMTNHQSGHRKFWLMIDFLNKWREKNNTGEFNGFFAITDKNSDGILSKISNLKNKDVVLQGLGRLSRDNLENLDNYLNVTKVNNLLIEWEKNLTNNEEVKFWQPFFSNNSWILAQLFASPFINIGKEFFCGGKRGNNKGGVYTDFLYKNSLTGNLAFIEIKTPKTNIISSIYRGKNESDNNSIYSIDKDLTGAVNQVLNQRNIFIQKKDSLEEYDKHCAN